MDSSKQELADVYTDCGSCGAWPWQLLCFLEGLVARRRRERIALILWMLRLWGQLRRAVASGWCAANADHWYQAVKGSSALQYSAASLGLLCGETADELMVSYADVNPQVAFGAALRVDFFVWPSVSDAKVFACFCFT